MDRGCPGRRPSKPQSCPEFHAKISNFGQDLTLVQVKSTTILNQIAKNIRNLRNYMHKLNLNRATCMPTGSQCEMFPVFGPITRLFPNIC